MLSLKTLSCLKTVLKQFSRRLGLGLETWRFVSITGLIILLYNLEQLHTSKIVNKFNNIILAAS